MGQFVPEARQLLIREQGTPRPSGRVRVPLKRQEEVDLVSIRSGRAILKVDLALASFGLPLRQKPLEPLPGAASPQSDDVARPLAGADLGEAICEVDQGLPKRRQIVLTQVPLQTGIPNGLRNVNNHRNFESYGILHYYTTCNIVI